MRLAEKTVIITGAAQGIGRACADVALSEGATVCLWDIDAEALDKTVSDLEVQGHGTDRVVARRTDVGDSDDVAAALADAIETAGPAHGLINNAAIVRKGTFLELSADVLDEVYRINLRGYFCVAQMVAQSMVDAEIKGAIVNMSSLNGQVAIPDQCAYVMMKGGVNQLTKTMALSLAPHGIRANAVSPGSIATELFKQVVRDDAARRVVLSRTPLGRPGEPNEVGQLTVFLLSSDSSYITGEIITIDGGRMALNYVVPVPD